MLKPPQDWEDMQLAVSSIHEFLAHLEQSRLKLGDVVKTEYGSIGVVVGLEAPEEFDGEWQYSVLIPNSGLDLSESYWFGRSALEVLEWTGVTQL